TGVTLRTLGARRPGRTRVTLRTLRARRARCTGRTGRAGGAGVTLRTLRARGARCTGRTGVTLRTLGARRARCTGRPGGAGGAGVTLRTLGAGRPGRTLRADTTGRPGRAGGSGRAGGAAFVLVVGHRHDVQQLGQVSGVGDLGGDGPGGVVVVAVDDIDRDGGQHERPGAQAGHPVAVGVEDPAGGVGGPVDLV